MYLRLDLNPVPASRPRVSRYGTYYGKRHQAFRSEALALLGDMREQGVLPSDPLSGRLQVYIGFFVKKPKGTKLETPRGDIDNYLKLVLDCCTTGGVWEDDTQVRCVHAFKTWASGRQGRTYLYIMEDSDADEPVCKFDAETCPAGCDPEAPEDERVYQCFRSHLAVPDLSTRSTNQRPSQERG